MSVMERLYLASGATISSCGSYRYSLERTWQDGDRLALFVGLNPSTADGNKDDPTIRRCVGFAKGLGCTGLLMGNLFALRSRSPELLHSHPAPIGPDNDAWLLRLKDRAHVTIFAWGSHKTVGDRCAQIISIMQPAFCLGVTAQGHPRHPLYLPKSASLARYPS